MKNPDVTDGWLPGDETPDVVGQRVVPPHAAKKTDGERKLGRKQEEVEEKEVEEEEIYGEEMVVVEKNWMDIFRHDFWGTDINSVSQFFFPSNSIFSILSKMKNGVNS